MDSKRIHISVFVFLSFFVCPLHFNAQQIFHAKVVDAETGEPVDFVTIGVGTRMHLLCNEEGEFTVTAEADEEVSFSRIGYEKLRIAARRLGREVRLKPLVKSLAEVTVLPIPKDEILRRCIANLEKDYKKGKKKDRLYFSRTIFVDGQGNEMLESFMKSHSVVNLRDPQIISGILSQDRNLDGRIRSTNVHHLLELGPKVYDSQFWLRSLLPLSNWDRVGDSYDTSYTLLTGNDSTRIYKFDLRYNNTLPEKWQGNKTVLEGSLYIRANDFRLLQFDGELKNLFMRVKVIGKPTSLGIHIEYQYENGYAEIANLSLQGGNDEMKYRTILFNVPDTITKKERGVRIKENLVKAITDADIDSTLWASTGIIQRTESEEQLAFGKSSESFMRKKHSGFVPDTTWTSNPRLRALRDRLYRFGKAYPQEKIFVHTDNTSYFLGDTIWFAAYTRQTNTDVPSRLSKVLYIELYNNDGYLVERKMMEMTDGWTNGFFALNQSMMYSGFYELRAYTRWQLNWGITEHWHSKVSSKWFPNKALEKDYYKDYDKLYSRVFPVYDKPTDKENPERNMTSRIMRRYFKKDLDEEERKPVLSLFPEGGNLVAGIPNRVAFEAVMSDGEQLEGTLAVGDETIPTVNRGRGVFTITPERGMEREVAFTTKDGKKVSAKLPKPEERGVALSVMQEGDEWVVSAGTVNLDSDSLAVMVTSEGNVEKAYELKPSYGIHDSELEAGIHQVTVFDTQGRVWADRLFFVTKPELSKPTLTVSGLKDEYKPYEKIELSVQTSPLHREGGGGGYISLSVRDGYQQDQLFDNGNIMTEMLLASEVKGFIPNPGWFFEKDDEQHRQALDLLMMTQGWRRFDWQDMALEGHFTFTQSAEQKPIVQGVVYNISDVNSLRDEKLLQELADRENQAIEDVVKVAEKRHKEGNQGTSTLEQMGQKKDDEENENSSETDANVYARQSATYTDEFSQKYNLNGNLKREVRVHAEFTPKIENARTFLLETETNQGHFQLEIPRFYGVSELHLAASDTTKWKRNHKHAWVVPQGYTVTTPDNSESAVQDRYPEFYVKVNFPYPRFVKPYSYYQKHTDDMEQEDETNFSGIQEDDESRTLREVAVKGRRYSGFRRYDQSQPAFIIDAQEMINLSYDSGIMFTINPEVRTLVGDYGLEWPFVGRVGENIAGYDTEPGEDPSRIFRLYGIPPQSAKYKSVDGRETPKDSIYSAKYIQTYGRGYYMRNSEYCYTPSCLDKYVIYTDYCPRLAGSKRYQGSNLPETRIALFPFNDKHIRMMYRDRYFVLEGFSYTAQFYSPDYSKQRLPEGQKDYRRTLYWNPSLELDEKGEAHVTLYNNSRTTHPNVEAAGQTAEGGLLWNKQ